jgi:hypothetical protein
MSVMIAMLLCFATLLWVVYPGIWFIWVAAPLLYVYFRTDP